MTPFSYTIISIGPSTSDINSVSVVANITNGTQSFSREYHFAVADSATTIQNTIQSDVTSYNANQTAVSQLQIALGLGSDTLET